jgi:hypothetical protein
VYFPKNDDAWEGIENTGDIPDLRRSIDDLITRARELGITRPRAHFVVLAMDGDRLSKLLAIESKRLEDLRSNADVAASRLPTTLAELKRQLSSALGTFARGVPERIEDEAALGRAVYAGGDDVFAFLPVETALQTAARIEAWYRSCLGDLEIDGWRATISAALVYAPSDMPLGVLVRRAHILLDDVAKGERRLGRDAFAIEVWSGSGPILQIGRPWSSLVSEGDANGEEVRWVEEIAWATQQLREDDMGAGVAASFSSRFFYRLQPILETIEPAGHQPLGREQQIDILLSEHLRTRRDDNSDTDAEQARQRIEQLERPRVERLARLLCRRSNVREMDRSQGSSAEDTVHRSGTLEWEMARFVRFLEEEE